MVQTVGHQGSKLHLKVYLNQAPIQINTSQFKFYHSCFKALSWKCVYRYRKSEWPYIFILNRYIVISLIDKSEAISPFAFRVIFGVIFSLSFFFFFMKQKKVILKQMVMAEHWLQIGECESACIKCRQDRLGKNSDLVIRNSKPTWRGSLWMLVGILDKVGSSEVVTGSPSEQHCPEGRILWVLERGCSIAPVPQGK